MEIYNDFHEVCFMLSLYYTEVYIESVRTAD